MPTVTSRPGEYSLRNEILPLVLNTRYTSVPPKNLSSRGISEPRKNHIGPFCIILVYFSHIYDSMPTKKAEFGFWGNRHLFLVNKAAYTKMMYIYEKPFFRSTFVYIT